MPEQKNSHVLQPLSVDPAPPVKNWEDFVGAKFYCLHVVADVTIFISNILQHDASGFVSEL